MEGSLVETDGIAVGEFGKTEMVCKEAVGSGQKTKTYLPTRSMHQNSLGHISLNTYTELHFYGGEEGVRDVFRTIVLTEFTRNR